MVNRFLEMFYWPLVRSIGFLHEFCHYIPAKYFGLFPILHWNYVDHTFGTKQQELIITASPIIVGLVILIPSIHGFQTATNNFIQYLFFNALIFSVGWLLACFHDITKIFANLFKMNI